MKKILIGKSFTEESLKTPGVYSFINFASASSLLSSKEHEKVKYFCDGVLSALFFSVACKEKVNRISFDFTSIADIVFSHAEKQKKGIYFIGASKGELEIFINKIITLYPNIKISGYRDGYFKEGEENEVAKTIIDSNASIIIAGLGAGKQEQLLSKVLSLGFRGVGFSCGGFIRQESSRKTDERYYPKIINQLNLRAFYRMYNEPHTIKRYIFEYPKNIIKLSTLIASSKLQAIAF